MTGRSEGTRPRRGAPLRIALCVSDHGWGHLNRDLVIVEEALRRGHRVTCAVSPAMVSPIEAAGLAVDLLVGRLDRGYALSAAGRLDREATRALVEECAAGPEAPLVEAVRAQRPHVVLADATPWASRIARALGVPGVLCSNFSWAAQFEAALGETEATRRVREDTRAFDLGLELPLGPGLPEAPERRRVPLLSRRAGETLPATLRDGAPFVTWAMGRTPPALQPLALLEAIGRLCARTGLRLAVHEALARHAGLAAVPLPDASPWAAVLAASRLTITKAGYSTVAEALRGAGHVLIAGVSGLPEERGMIADVEAAGWGLGAHVSAPEFEATMLVSAERLLARPPRAPVDDAGEVAVLDAVEAVARDA